MCASKDTGESTLSMSRVVHILINHGIDTSQRDVSGRQPVHIAAQCENVAALRALLAQNVDTSPTTMPSQLFPKGETALMMALRYGKTTAHSSCLKIALSQVGGGSAIDELVKRANQKAAKQENRALSWCCVAPHR